MGYIYKIENLINHKIYIGQTTRDYQRRWYEHIYKANNSNHSYAINQAINKYGQDKFSFSIIEECDNTLLDEKEKQYINQYQSHITQNGYNLSWGGEGHVKINRDQVKQLWLEGLACCDIAKQLNSTSDTVCFIIKQLFPDAKDEIKKRSNLNTKLYHEKPILQYDENGKLLNRFSSIKEATQVYCSNISRAIYGQIKSHGYYWCFDDGINHIDEILSRPRGATRKNKKVNQYDLLGNYITTFNSVKEAQLKIQTSHIGDVCNGNRKSAGGFLWKWAS